MYCLHCGAEIADNSKFCVQCGGKIEPAPAGEIGTTPVKEMDTTSEEKIKEVPDPVASTLNRPPNAKKIAMIAGVTAASVIFLGALVWGVLYFSGFLRAPKPQATDDSVLTIVTSTHPEPTQSVTEPSGTTAGTDEPLSPYEEGINTYNRYITDTLMPAYGLADPGLSILDSEWWSGEIYLTEFIGDDRKGLISAHPEDLNGDGTPELLVVISGTFAPPETNTNAGGEYVYQTHYDGIVIKVFTISDGTVQEMVCDNHPSIYSDVFMYSQGVSLQVSILEDGEDRYLYVYKFNQRTTEYSKPRFMHDIYQVTDTGLTCLKSILVTNGSIFNRLGEDSVFSNGTEIFSVLGGDNIDDFYGRIRENLTPYGLDCSWMDPYFNEIRVSVDEDMPEFSEVFSWGQDQSFTPLSALVSGVRVISIAGGKAVAGNFYGGKLTQNYVLFNMDDGLLPQPIRSVPFLNAEVESKVLIIRNQWTIDRDNITANTYTQTTVSPGIVSYHNGSEIVMIEIAAGTNGNVFARTYQYKDGLLIFAFWDGPPNYPDHRFYFDGNVLFRWRYQLAEGDPVNYDNTIAHGEYVSLEKSALDEGLLVLSQANGS